MLLIDLRLQIRTPIDSGLPTPRSRRRIREFPQLGRGREQQELIFDVSDLVGRVESLLWVGSGV